jgi:CubicO group peptidase (beta-lactamase class C family)
MIGTAVMQLEEQGKINLDEDINMYLPIAFRHPNFPNEPITTRMLLTHRAGLSWPKSYDPWNGMWNQFDRDQGPSPSEWVPQFLIPSGTNYDPALWKPIRPGDYEFYSNIGICVAAYIVEAISEQNFRDYCKEHIFMPLEMLQTSYNYSDLYLEEIAVMYDRGNIPSYFFDNRVYASGGVKSTVKDLSRFAACYLNKGKLNNKQILKEPTVNKILEIQNQVTGRCLVWEAYPGDWYGHTGGLDLGTTTSLAIHPRSGVSMIIFTNTPSRSVTPGGDIFSAIRRKANEFID